MHLVHDISLTKVKEASTIREFIYLCCLFPIPSAQWVRLKKNKQQIEKYLAYDNELPTEMMIMFHANFEKYKQSKCKLLMGAVTKHATAGSSLSKNETNTLKPETDTSTKSMEE